jgi:hypothetical protein
VESTYGGGLILQLLQEATRISSCWIINGISRHYGGGLGFFCKYNL